MSFLRSSVSGILLALFPLVLMAGCGPRYTDQDIAAASQRLSHLYALRNYEIAMQEGRTWQNAGPRAFEPRAWFVINTARYSSIEDLSDSTVAWGEAMVKEAPKNPWSWFALAGALNYHRSRGKEALAASDSMLRLSSGLPFLRVRADVLLNQESDSAAVAFVSSLPDSIQQKAVMLVRRGVAESWEAMDAHDDSLMDAAQATFARARAADSTNVEAVYLAGAYLYDVRKYDEAFPLLERAAQMTTAGDVHFTLWQTIQGRRSIAPDEKKALVQKDAEALLKANPTADNLRAVSGIYRTLGLDAEADSLEDVVLAEHPNTPAAEWVLVNRYRAVAKDLYEQKQAGETVDPAKQAEYARMLWAFIARPEHFQKRLLGDAYRSLFTLEVQFLHDDSVVNGDTLYKLVRGMVDYEGINPQIVYGAGPVALADDSTHLDEAARIAREGLAEGKSSIDDAKEHGIFETDGDYQQALDRASSIMYDALGWVYLAQGRIDMAEDTLRHAAELNPRNQTALYHLGRLFERRAGSATDGADLDSAQAYFIRGAMVRTMGENPNDEALKELYQRRHGSLDGWDTFHADIAEIDRASRRKKVLATREEEPAPIKAFTLASLTGEQVSSRSLRGKVAVINFWGTWCGPCVAEMPEMQKFAARYRNDPSVAVYTIDNDPDPDDVRTWMTKHKYDFPVLLDDGYVSDAGVHVFPTTWFVDPQGRIEFVKTGWSAELAEEFAWRVDALRNGR